MLSVVFSSVGEMELEWRESKLSSKIIWEGRKGSKKVVEHSSITIKIFIK